MMGPQHESPATSKGVHRRARWRLLLYAVLVIAGLSAAATAAGDFSDAYDLLRHISVRWLGLAIVVVSFRFVFLGAQLRRLRGTAEVPDRRLGIGIALVAFGLGDLMPASPAEGFALSSAALRRRGMTPRQIWLMLGTSQWVQFWALIMVFAADRVVVAANGELHRHHAWLVVIGSALAFAITAIASRLMRSPATARRLSVLTSWLPSQHEKTAAQRADTAVALQRDFRQNLGTRRNRVVVTALAALSLLADATALWCMLTAVHAGVSFEIAIMALVVAEVAAWVPLLPSGIGLTEIAVPALLHHFQVPIATGLAAVLLWRAVSLLLPAAAGLGVWATLRSRSRLTRQPEPRARTTSMRHAPAAILERR
ncbi:MAG: Lysylphosphatidylglycerol synthase region [Actinomycetota bacterium]|jgi:uncharacterized protein (TIRG00374 family)|nr:Lysylphosphatidylglycerol synthase region [Actinomycetota bacterium]